MKIPLKIHKSCFKFGQLIYKLPSQPCPIGSCEVTPGMEDGAWGTGSSPGLDSLAGPKERCRDRGDLVQISREKHVHHNPQSLNGGNASHRMNNLFDREPVQTLSYWIRLVGGQCLQQTGG